MELVKNGQIPSNEKFCKLEESLKFWKVAELGKFLKNSMNKY